MKTSRLFYSLSIALIFLFGLAAFSTTGSAQVAGALPVVRIFATDASATFAGDTGTFTVIRDGTNLALNVFFAIGGTASNGVDYAAIPYSILIPAGQRTNAITVAPIDLGQTGPAAVMLQLLPSPMNSQGYLPGVPSNAVVTIYPAKTNLPPYVAITMPTNGSIFPPGQDVGICAYATDRDDYVATVEFFADNRSLGITTNNPLSASPLNPFCLVWPQPPVGTHVLVARATDAFGATALSQPVRITIQPPLIPMVNIVVRDNTAREIPLVPPGMGMPQMIDPAVFAFVRSGPTNDALSVTYDIAGTASNGIDYEKLSGTVLIPAGALAAEVVVLPIDDTLVEGTETVVLTLQPTACAAIIPPPPGCYFVGPANTGVAYILDNDSPTNLPPLARITSPPNGAIFRQPINIPIFAYAYDRDDLVASVEFLDGTNSLGQGKLVLTVDSTNLPPRTCATCPPPVASQWTLVWSNAPLGEHVLRALATDSRGATGLSDPVKIAVLPPPPPPTNPPPLPVISVVATDPIAIEGTNCWTRCVPTNWPISGVRTSAIPCYPIKICGPKNATFAVIRDGNPTNEITVTYAIGGTATNGVDYVKLPGTITIPAFEKRALITVVPLDDGPPDINSTVVLRLVPSSATPPDYALGLRRSAAALIIDSNLTPPWTRMLADRCFHLNAPGPDGAWFRVEVSTDLVHWTALCTNQVFNGTVDFIDPDAAVDNARMYRAVPEPTAP